MNWRPPWYKWANSKLEGSEWLINVLLIFIVAITLFLLLRGDRLSRTAWLIYLVSP